MQRTRHLKSALVLLVVTLGLHVFSVYFLLYFEMEWIDVILHSLGGAGVGFLGVVVFWPLLIHENGSLNEGRVYLTAIVSVIAVGTAWEVFEYTTGFIVASSVLVEDTAIDMAVNILGATFAGSRVISLSFETPYQTVSAED